jgi:DNA (cytosine-5)-methyltransferase 1
VGKIKFISLFSGIGGFDLGLERAGMECVAQVDIDPFCQKVLAKHWPNVERFSDVRQCGKHNLPPADLICGGFPCQPHSNAGERKGIRDERDMWPEFYRIVCEIRPRWIVAENVPGILSSDDGKFFGGILGYLSKIGYSVEWDAISASSFSAVHERKRVFIVSYPDSTGLVECGGIFRKLAKADGQEKKIVQAVGLANMVTCEYLSSARNWPCESVFLRKHHGVSNRTHRVRALGNAVVPQVIEWIGRMIIEADL